MHVEWFHAKLAAFPSWAHACMHVYICAFACMYVCMYTWISGRLHKDACSVWLSWHHKTSTRVISCSHMLFLATFSTPHAWRPKQKGGKYPHLCNTIQVWCGVELSMIMILRHGGHDFFFIWAYLLCIHSPLDQSRRGSQFPWSGSWLSIRILRQLEATGERALHLGKKIEKIHRQNLRFFMNLVRFFFFQRDVRDAGWDRALPSRTLKHTDSLAGLSWVATVSCEGINNIDTSHRLKSNRGTRVRRLHLLQPWADGPRAAKFTLSMAPVKVLSSNFPLANALTKEFRPSFPGAGAPLLPASSAAGVCIIHLHVLEVSTIWWWVHQKDPRHPVIHNAGWKEILFWILILLLASSPHAWIQLCMGWWALQPEFWQSRASPVAVAKHRDCRPSPSWKACIAE